MQSLHPAAHSADDAGFTLVEMLLTVAVIIALATIAVPNYMSAKVASNEGAALATLRSIATAQLQFRNAVIVDADLDGEGEFGRLGELCGTATLRGRAETLRPALLPASLSIDGAGRASKAGYWFALHLPDAAGLGLTETDANVPAIAADLAEHHFTCLAWPARSGASGVHAFFVNEQGELRKNRSGRYSGTVRVPPAGAALLGTISAAHIDGQLLASGVAGADGQTWHPVH